MGSTNYGNQKLSIDYKEALTAKVANYNNHEVISPGILQGLELEKISNVQVRITAGVMVIKDIAQPLTLKCETQNNYVDQAISPTNPWIIARLEWLDVESNYVDFLAVANEAAINDTDIILGKGIFNLTNLEGFDYTSRTVNPLKLIKDKQDEFKITLDDPYSNTIYINPGKVVIDSTIVNYAGGSVTVPVISVGTARNDLITIDIEGTATVVEGQNDSSFYPTIPNKHFLLAIIERTGAGNNIVLGSDITIIKDFYLNKGSSTLLIGSEGVSYTLSSPSGTLFIESNSEIEVNGIRYQVDPSSLEPSGITSIPNGSQAYIVFSPTGSSVVPSYTVTPPTWFSSKNGWYDATGTNRYLYSARIYTASPVVRDIYKVSTTGLDNNSLTSVFNNMEADNLSVTHTVEANYFDSGNGFSGFYPMNQPVRTVDEVEFSAITAGNQEIKFYYLGSHFLPTGSTAVVADVETTYGVDVSHIIGLYISIITPFNAISANGFTYDRINARINRSSGEMTLENNESLDYNVLVFAIQQT